MPITRAMIIVDFLSNAYWTIRKVVLDTKDNLIALAMGMITITALGYQAGFEVLLAATVAASVVGLASLLSNLYVAAPFLTSFRGLAKSEGWQRFILLRAPSFAFGQLVVLIVITGGVFRWIQVVAAITAIIMALAFFSQSAQSRAHQLAKSELLRLFDKSPQLAKLGLMISNMGLQDVLDTWLQMFKARGYVQVLRFTAKIINTHFWYISKDAREKCIQEIFEYFELPQGLRDELTVLLKDSFPKLFEGMNDEELDAEIMWARNEFSVLAEKEGKVA